MHPIARLTAMKSIRELTEKLERALSHPREEFGRFTRFVLLQIDLWRFCARRLREHNVMAMSSALSFRTIFAMIPVLVLTLLMMRSFGALEDSQRTLRKVLEASGFSQIMTAEEGETQPAGEAAPGSPPGRVMTVADRIEEIVANVSSKLTFQRIGPVGGALLIWTAITLLSTIEECLNRVFGAQKERPLARRVLLYWSAMTLGPIALATASYLGDQAMKQAMRFVQGAPGSAWALAIIGWLAPIIVGVIVLALVYTMLPNTRVPFRPALAAATVVVPVWLVAKWGFALYVRSLVVKGNLYGVLGLLPLFLMWLNLSWWIFLFGAELAHTGANLSEMRRAEQAERLVLGPSDLVAAVLAIARHYRAGSGPMTRNEMAAALNLSGESAQWLIERLRAGGLLLDVDRKVDTGYLLSKPPDQVAVLEVVGMGDPRMGAAATACGDPQVAAALEELRNRGRRSMEKLTFADLLEQAARAAD